MRRYPAILDEQAHSVTLVVRLAREFMRPHARRIALAGLLMGLAAASTAARAWLMQPVLETCDRNEIPAYLESSKERNVAFYSRHGFKVTQEITLPKGPPIWLMWRDPRP